MKKVNSSMISEVGYKNSILTLVYKTGGTYNYHNVDKKIYNGLLKAESKGQYIRQNILSKYTYTKIK